MNIHLANDVMKTLFQLIFYASISAVYLVSLIIMLAVILSTTSDYLSIDALIEYAEVWMMVLIVAVIGMISFSKYQR